MPAPAVAPGDLTSLDVLDVDLLVLPLYAVRAQPRGAAGNVDWRLSGRIARLIASGRFAGQKGEAVLMTALERVGASRLLLVGLGAPVPGAAPALEPIVRVLADARAASAAVAIPEAPAGDPSAALVREAWRGSSAWRALDAAPVTLLDASLPRPPSVPPPPA